MGRFIKVIKFYQYHNKIECTYEMHIKMCFTDRLKFLLFGENCTFCFWDEEALGMRKERLKDFRNWVAKKCMQEVGDEDDRN